MDSYYFWNKINILQKYRQRRIPTTRISRVERDMDACLAGNILGRTNRLSRNGNAVFLVDWVVNRRGLVPDCGGTAKFRIRGENKSPRA